MSRSKWKGPFLNGPRIDDFTKTNILKTFSRSSVILPLYVGKTVGIHNGNSFVNITITKKMIGKKLGEFSTTRKPFSYKKKK